MQCCCVHLVPIHNKCVDMHIAGILYSDDIDLYFIVSILFCWYLLVVVVVVVVVRMWILSNTIDYHSP